ncbi:MAG: hypothetical protein ACQEXQ_29775 [Bacillota bacterium]
MELLKISKELKQAGQLLLRESGLEKILSNYGEVHPDGSFFLDLMYDNCDIDFYITNPVMSKELALNLLNSLMWLNYFDGHLFYDWTNKTNHEFPPSYYIGLKIKNHQDRTWKVDIWLHKTNNNNKTELYKSLINPSNKETILSLKHYRKYNSNKNKILSVHIYDAVLLHGVTTLDEFIEYHNELIK